VLRKKYNIKQVHLSGKGRWFKNADVVTTIIVLEKKSNNQGATTDFWLWKQSLEQLATDADKENTLVNSALLGLMSFTSIRSVYLLPCRVQFLYAVKLICGILQPQMSIHIQCNTDFAMSH